jgi:hypothetical protein
MGHVALMGRRGTRIVYCWESQRPLGRPKLYYKIDNFDIFHNRLISFEIIIKQCAVTFLNVTAAS